MRYVGEFSARLNHSEQVLSSMKGIVNGESKILMPRRGIHGCVRKVVATMSGIGMRIREVKMKKSCD